MIAALMLALLAIAAGTLASYAYDDDGSLATRLAGGLAIGFVAVSVIGLVLANLVGIGTASMATVVIAAIPLAGLLHRPTRARLAADVRATGHDLEAAVRQPSATTVGPIVYGAVATALLWLVFDKVIIEHDGGLFTGFVNNLGDLPFHLGVTTSFVYGRNFPPQDPTFAGTGFAYPYLSDLLAAMFVSLGASMRDAFFLENLLLGLALVGLLYRFARLVTADRLAGYLAPVLVLFSGGLGWVVLFQDARSSESGLVALLGALPHDYTIGQVPFRWGNAITVLFVTQRSLLLGLPIALAVFVLLWKLVHVDRAAAGSVPPGRIALVAGLLTGSLPLVHAHSFIAVFGTAFLLGILFRQWREGRWRWWAIYVVSALALALPQIWWSTHDSVANAGTFFGLEFGWDHGDTNILWFWFVNTGLFIPLAVTAAVWRWRAGISSRSLVLFTVAFAAWFVVPNVIKLAPWVWDNIKVLIYWYVGFVPIVALLLARLIRSGPGLRAAGLAALLAMTLAGGVDVWHVISGQTEYGEYDASGIAFADAIKQDTAPNALLLNAPTWNAPVFLTGRRTLMGYTGHVFSRGLPYLGRESDIQHIYAGGADAVPLLATYGIQYVEVGPLERDYMKTNGLTLDEAFFQQFTKVAEAGEYVLYETARP